MDVAGVVAGVVSSILGPLVGVLGGIAQAAGQAAQVATQAAQGAAKPASEADPVDTGRIGEAGEAAEADERDPGKEDHPDDADRDVTGETAGDDSDAEGLREAIPDGDSAGEGGGGPAMTLPPDLEVASASWAGEGPAPVFVPTDLEQGQLRPPVTATLERGIPGSAAVLNR
ncbi:hypothetical protein BVU76_16195 [Mycolicibacterium porcinum]|nr:hypothetical protein BVU76_16195 [Mycolicibacterium porcinum]